MASFLTFGLWESKDLPFISFIRNIYTLYGMEFFGGFLLAQGGLRKKNMNREVKESINQSICKMFNQIDGNTIKMNE